MDALLDSAAQGVVRVKRGQQTVEYPSRFTLVGTMNPEEGELRPQITDRLGLRVFVGPAQSAQERTEIYRRNAAFARDRAAFSATYAKKTRDLRKRVARAIDLLPAVTTSEGAERLAIESVIRLGIESHRTEFVALEAACALAAYEGRREATDEDVRRVFAMAARLRRSRLRVQAQTEYHMEDALINSALEQASEEGQESAEAPPPTGRRSSSHPILRNVHRDEQNQTPATRGKAPGRARSPAEGLDVPATVLSIGVAARGSSAAEPMEAVESAIPLHLTVFIVDASQSTVKSAAAVHAAMSESLRPIYAGRERAALISCWGPDAEVVVDESVGRNVELVAERLTELAPDESRALTPFARCSRASQKNRCAFPQSKPER